MIRRRRQWIPILAAALAASSGSAENAAPEGTVVVKHYRKPVAKLEGAIERLLSDSA